MLELNPAHTCTYNGIKPWCEYAWVCYAFLDGSQWSLLFDSGPDPLYGYFSFHYQDFFSGCSRRKIEGNWYCFCYFFSCFCCKARSWIKEQNQSERSSHLCTLWYSWSHQGLMLQAKWLSTQLQEEQVCFCSSKSLLFWLSESSFYGFCESYNFNLLCNNTSSWSIICRVWYCLLLLPLIS